MKKLLTILCTLVLAFSLFAFIGCKKNDNKVKTKANPMVSDSDKVFASIKEGEYKYEVKNGELYLSLKVNAGIDVLVNIVDEYLLKNASKNYFDGITSDEINEKITLDVYGEDEDLTEDEKAELEEDFLESLFITLNIEAEDIYDEAVQDAYRLALAEKAYAKDVLIEEIKENDKKYAEYEALSDEEKAKAEDPVTAPYYADSKYQAKYEKDNESSYNAIIVTFPSYRLATLALQAIGVTEVDGLWTGLSDNQVVEKFIELYNYNYGYKGLSLTKDSDEFKYTETELNAVNANIATRISTKMVCMGEKGTWYYGKPYEAGSGSLYTFICKLGENKATAWEDLSEDEKENQKANYLDDLYEDSLTSGYIMTKLAELREEKNFVIYDTVLEMDYNEVILNYGVEFKKTTEESKTVVAKVDGKEVTADELFKELASMYAISGASEILSSKRLIGNKEFNPYYQDGKWVDADKKEELEGLVKAEKKNFENGTYSSHGYDTTTSSWETFIEASYSVRTDEELLMYYLADAVAELYASKINYLVSGTKDKDGKITYDKPIEGLEESKLWTALYTKMQEKVDAFFSVKGIHLLINAFEDVNAYVAGSTPLNPEEWTEEQNEKALELANKLINFINDCKGTYTERLEKIVNAWKVAPSKVGTYTFNEKAVDTTLTSDNGAVVIDIAEYKAYGLYVKYESLGTFTNGSMVEAFNDAVKGLYDTEVAAGNFGTDKSKVVVLADPIKTEFGYHVYVNLQVNQQSYAEKITTEATEETEEEVTYRYLPTLEEIRIYNEDNSSSSLSSYVKSSISTYYTKFAEELAGDYFAQASRYYQLLNLQVESSEFTQSAFQRYVEYFYNYLIDENLTYVTSDFLE